MLIQYKITQIKFYSLSIHGIKPAKYKEWIKIVLKKTYKKCHETIARKVNITIKIYIYI